MVQINKLHIDSNGFRLKSDAGLFDLITGDRNSETGGITVVPELSIEGIADGFLYIHQLCTNHTISIRTVDEHSFSYESTNILRDSPNPDINEAFYQRYKINQNQVQYDFAPRKRQLRFWDGPCKGLCRNWTEFSFAITFQTWFQYKKSVTTDEIPILSFTWELDANAKKIDGDWKLIESNYSSVDKILASVKYYTADSSPVNPNQYEHLSQTMKSFYESDPLITDGEC